MSSMMTIRYFADFDPSTYSDGHGSFLPAHLTPWKHLPEVMKLGIWVFVDPWPTIMILRGVCKGWNISIGRLEPNVPSAQLAYEKGRQVERDIVERKKDRKKMKRVRKRERRDREEYM
jgi:hypothetical protein